MKLKYFLSFFALIALLSSCSDNDAMTLLDEIQVSSSYVTIDLKGGSTTITLTASDAWSFDAEEIPSWLTVTPMSGGAGQNSVTFSASGISADEGRSTVLHVACAGKKQNINVMQGLIKATEATCAQVIAGPESKTYRVTGTITSWYGSYEQYGNMYIADETGSVLIYGMADKDGKLKNYPIKSWGLELGDVITVEGPKTVYNGTVELVDVTVVKVQKWMIQVAEPDPAKDTIPLEGGSVNVHLLCKSTHGISVDIPDAAKSWLGIESIAGGSEPLVTFRANANTGGDRSATVTFRTTDDAGMVYSVEAKINQKGAIVACTVAEFLAAEEGATQYRLNGMVVGKYRDTQGFYVRDYTGEVLIYKPSGFTGTEVNVGDVVTVLGVRTSYKGDPQMGSATLEKINYTAQPISIADFRNLPDNKEAYYIISGEIVNATEPNTKNDVTQYGNFNLKDETGEVYIYGVYTGWGGQKGHFGELDLTWNDHLTIVAYKTSYNGLIEGVGYYLSSEKAR